MQTKSFALIALSATAAVASPFHRRSEHHHHKHHGTGMPSGIRPTGSAGLFPIGNDTNGLFQPTGVSTTTTTETMFDTQLLTMTVSPLPASASSPANLGNKVAGVEASSSCISTSLSTLTSTNYVTVTASPTAAAKVADANTQEAASPGAFYGGQSRSYGGNGWGSSSQAAPSVPVVSTTFATVPSAAPSVASSAAKSSSAAMPSSSTPVTGGSSSGKRGISFNDASLVSAFGKSVSWSYNWGATESGSLGGVEFVPMMWGLTSVSNFASTAAGATHVLSFNEPDLSSQSNIDPATAAKQHIAGMKGLVGKAKIGSPAVTNGDSTSPLMGVPWLNSFFQACAGQCQVDFVAFHWYAPANNFAYFTSHVESVIAAAKANGVDKVWLTEFAPSGDLATQASFMAQAIPYLESKAEVERYAAFMASDGTLLSGKTLNAVGTAYIS